MTARSLGFATDLALRAAEGSEVLRSGGVNVVRTPGNPAFRWGNFILVPEAGDPEARVRQHAAAFPGAGFVTIGVDDARAEVDDGAWRAAGFEVERLVVLTAERALQQPAARALVRPLQSDDDWAAQTAIAFELEPDGDDAHLEFTRRVTAVKRAAVERGSMLWLGVEDGGRIVATAGVGDAGGGLARFQDVQTREPFRRRGYAGALIAAGVAAAARAFGSSRSVLVAEPDGPAIGLYRRLGFRDVETQVQLSRVDR